MRLTRPWHYVAFGAFCIVLFLGVFQVTLAFVAPADANESVPGVPSNEPGTPRVGTGGVNPALDVDLPNLRIASATVHECLAPDPESDAQSQLVVVVRNDGAAATGGFLLLVDADVQNNVSDAVQHVAIEEWAEDIPVGQEQSFALPIAYPLAHHGVTGLVASAEPVPGDYWLRATVDHPADPKYEAFGSAGVLPEESDADNEASLPAKGLAAGPC